MILYIDKVFDDELFASKGYYANYVKLTWSCTDMAEYVTRFKIYRKEYESDADSTLVGVATTDDRTWEDEYAEANTLYEYTVYADGITSDFKIEGINYIQGVGFRVPTGRITGRITYSGGTAVEGVKITAETKDEFSSYSLDFNGDDYLSLTTFSDNSLFDFENGFAFETWYRPDGGTGKQTLFSREGMFNIFFDADNAQIGFTIQNTNTVYAGFEVKQDTFLHVTASYDGDIATIVVQYSSNSDDYHASSKVVGSISSNTSAIYIGKNESGEYLNGYLKDIRLWNTSLDSVSIVIP